MGNFFIFGRNECRTWDRNTPVASTVVDIVSPSAKRVRTTFFDASTNLIEIDNSYSAGFEGIGGWNIAGAPSGGAFGINRSKAVLKSLFDRPLHGIQIDFTVALNVNVCI